jgi:hypothetical protein
VLLLEYLIQTKKDFFRPRRILWMISEGSDLEDNYDDWRPLRPLNRLSAAFRRTILEALAAIPVALRDQSILNQLLTGRLTLAWPSSHTQENTPYWVDGVRLLWPLYRSARFGYRCFEPYFLKHATMPESYVLEHPNLPRLDQTFRAMAALSTKHGFEVTVILGPSDSRLYGEHFENFPALSKEPYFLNYVERLSRSLGFQTVNLYLLLKPYARNELLHFRDDVHWNERGNEVVAEIIAQQVFGHRPASEAVGWRCIPQARSAEK